MDAGIYHKFEKAGLGKAPFRVVGFEQKYYQAHPDAPMQPGAACDYCATGIVDTFWIKGVDGKVFKVGSDCVNKTGDKGLVNVVKRQINAIRTAARHKREAVKIAAIKESFTPEVRSELEKFPHPNEWFASQGKTLADYADFLWDRAGTAGKLAVGKMIENHSKGKESL